MPDATIREVLPSQYVCLTTTARGQVTIEVKVSDTDSERAAQRAESIFDRLRAKYKELNDANAEFYPGKV